MSEQPLNFVDYDFDNLVSQLQDRLKLKDAWKDMYRSSTGSMLIELFAAIGNLVLYYIERRAEESYIGTAQNKSSIINLARLLNYIPKRNVSSTGTLRFSIQNPHTEMVFIPKYTQVMSNDGYSFVVKNDGVIMPGSTYVDVEGIQGVKVSVINTSTGTTDQEYNVTDTTIENENIIIRVDNEDWEQVSSFINSTNTSKHYMLRPELDDTLTIVFGNNVFGKSPTIGSSIEIIYIKSDGSEGNVYDTNLITILQDTIYDALGNPIDVEVTNTTTFLGGADIESADEIRESAPKVFSTGDRLVTKNDYKAVLNAYPGVADSNAWGEAEETAPDYNMYNQVKLVVLLDNWVSPDSSFEQTLSDYLYEKSLMTVRYSFVDPVILEVIPTLTAKVKQGYSLSYIQSQIETAISDNFILGDTSKLGTHKRISGIIADVEAIEGVSYIHIILKIRKELSDSYDSLYDWSETCDATPLLPNGVEVYIDNNLIAMDDGLGNIIGSSSIYTVSGDVNYTTGKVGVNISPSPSPTETVYVRYQQAQNGDIVVTQNQICRWIENNYTSISYDS